MIQLGGAAIFFQHHHNVPFSAQHSRLIFAESSLEPTPSLVRALALRDSRPAVRIGRRVVRFRELNGLVCGNLFRRDWRGSAVVEGAVGALHGVSVIRGTHAIVILL